MGQTATDISPATASESVITPTGTVDLKAHNTVIRVLEMEDVLFHLDSAVMMPENPQGASSSQGTSAGTAQQQQAAITGVRALAIVFRYAEFHPTEKILIAGHTDTSGGYQLNYELSALRAKNVLYLLIGTDSASFKEGEQWAAICAGRHKIEDYQQIMKHFDVRSKGSWNCDPGAINNSWNKDTEAACEAFFDKVAPTEKAVIMSAIKGHGQKKWPKAAWEKVYPLYIEELRETLAVDENDLLARRTSLLTQFADSKKLFVSCGESFPIDQKDKTNYRSQVNRRVEILFLDESQVPKIDCPVDAKGMTRKHRTKGDPGPDPPECPLWNNFHRKEYIKPEYLYAKTYFLQFTYFNPIKQQLSSVPGGLQIEAVRFTGENLRTVGKFSNDVYEVTVFLDEDTKKNHPKEWSFRFQTKTQWVFTENKDAAPEMQQIPLATVHAAPLQDRMKFYDLPAEWNSRNWFCSVGNKRNEFVQLIDQQSKSTTPMVFCLDDTVLVDAAESQVLQDANAGGTAKALDREKSRFHILYVNKDERMAVYESVAGGKLDPDVLEIPAAPAGTKVRDPVKFRFPLNSSNIPMNFIGAPVGNIKAIVFCGRFYVVGGRRARNTGTNNFDFGKGHLVGAREAMLEDPLLYHKKIVAHAPPADHKDAHRVIHHPKIGDFEVHFIAQCGIEKNISYSYLIVYYSTFVIGDPHPTAAGNPTRAEINHFIMEGIENAIKHWNNKDYIFEERAPNADPLKNHNVKPFYFFESNETLVYVPPAPPPDIKGDDYDAVFKENTFKNALNDTFGGKPRGVTFIVEGAKTPYDWCLSVRSANRAYSIVALTTDSYQGDTGARPQFTEYNDKEPYSWLTMAHEFGHATGQVDDYLEEGIPLWDHVAGKWETASVAVMGQRGLDTSYDWIANTNTNLPNRIIGIDAYEIQHRFRSMMNENGPVRMRYFWRFVKWLNDESATAGTKINQLIGTREYRIRYRNDATEANQLTFECLPPSAAAGATVLQQNRTVNPWRFIRERISFGPAGSRRSMDAFLYYPLDECRRLRRNDWTLVPPKTTPYADVTLKAILVLRVLVTVEFVNFPNVNAKRQWLLTLSNIFRQNFLKGVNGSKFMLRAGDGSDLDPTLIHFLPGFHDHQVGNLDAVCNYHVTVDDTGNNALAQAATTLSVGTAWAPGGVDHRQALFNYFFNKPAGNATFAPADLEFVRSWFATKFGNNSFRIVDLEA
jgi:hypothetical protein